MGEGGLICWLPTSKGFEKETRERATLEQRCGNISTVGPVPSWRPQLGLRLSGDGRRATAVAFKCMHIPLVYQLALIALGIPFPASFEVNFYRDLCHTQTRPVTSSRDALITGDQRTAPSFRPQPSQQSPRPDSTRSYHHQVPTLLKKTSSASDPFPIPRTPDPRCPPAGRSS